MPPSSTPAPASVRVPEGARWACHECGACCRLFQLGPVEPAIVEGLRARDVGAAWAPAAAGFAEARPTPEGPAWYLKKVDGACVFLQPDNRCAVHRLYGAEAKPAFCREFPFHLIEDDLGLALVARGECAGFFESSRTGAPMEDYAAEVLALPHPRGVPRFAPEKVTIVAGLEVERSRWMELEAALLAKLNPGEGPSAQPEALVALSRTHLFSGCGVRGPAADPARLRGAMGALLQAIGMVLDHVLSTETAAPPAERTFTAELREALRRAESRLAAPLPPLDDDAARHANLLLRSAILSKGFQSVGGVGPGLGLFLFNTRVAQLAAEVGPEGSISPAAFSAVYAAFVRLTLNATLQRVLLSARPALVDGFVHAAG